MSPVPTHIFYRRSINLPEVILPISKVPWEVIEAPSLHGVRSKLDGTRGGARGGERGRVQGIDGPSSLAKDRQAGKTPPLGNAWNFHTVFLLLGLQ